MKSWMPIALGSLLFTQAFAAEFIVRSPDITPSSTIAEEQVFNGFGCQGGNISPALSWSGAPAGTKSYAVTVYDPDAPTGSGWWHWVVFNIPASVNGLAKNAGSTQTNLLPPGSIQSRTDFGKPGYENGKSVIGIGVRGSSSSLLISNCDEFIFYEDIVQIKPPKLTPVKKPPTVKSASEPTRDAPTPAKSSRRRARPATGNSLAEAESPGASPAEPSADDKKTQAIEIVVGTVEQLVAERGGEGYISASLIKNTIKRIRPGFSESEYGYSAFGKILDDAQKRGVLTVDKKEGGAVIVSLPASRV